jgi:hypothetical protein
MTITGRLACIALVATGVAGIADGQSAAPETEWISIFDGKSLAGWKKTAFSGRGDVQVTDGIIRLGSGRMTGITWAGEFPRSGYEVRFEAARLEGKDFFAAIVFPVHDSYCSWINGGWDGTVVGLSNIDGSDASENETSTIRDFVSGRWYAFRLVVTDTRIQGWIDGAVVIDVDIRGREVGLRFDDTDLCTPLGFASYATVGGLRKIEYRLLDGKVRK